MTTYRVAFYDSPDCAGIYEKAGELGCKVSGRSVFDADNPDRRHGQFKFCPIQQKGIPVRILTEVVCPDLATATLLKLSFDGATVTAEIPE